MENKNIDSSPIYKLYELNFPDIYFFDKIDNLDNSSNTKKIKNHRNINKYKYKSLILNGKTQELSEINKSTLILNNKNFYSLESNGHHIKSLKDNEKIKNSLNNERNDSNYLNIKKIIFPSNHMNAYFDTTNRNNNQINENFEEIEEHLKLNNNEKLTSCLHPKSQRKIFNMKRTKQASYKFQNKNLSNIHIDKRSFNKIGDSLNLPSILYLQKKKLDININNFDKILSFNPKESILKKLYKHNTFSKSLESYTSKNGILNQKNTYNNFEYSNRKNDEKKLIKIENNVKEILQNSSNKDLKLFINKKANLNNKNVYDLPPLNYYKNSYYYYNIYPSNCGWLIKECFSHRLRWKKCHSNNTNLFNFKWKEVINCNDEFLELNKKKKQIINHFQYHSSLSNKYNMFYNFAIYCEENNMNIFKYLPFTIVIDINNSSLFYSYRKSFKKIFDNIENYIFDSKSINDKIFDRRKIPYQSYFPWYNTKFGLKLYCEISNSHYAGKNLWIVKAPNLNRGRGVKIFNNYNDIISYIKKVGEGKITETELYNFKDKEYNEKLNNHKKNEIENSIERGVESKNTTDYIYQSNKIIIQKYIEKPFLYKGRKCDIRIWVLITHTMKVYIFKEGHLKASSLNYNNNDFDSFIHITNYSLQKYNKLFSKFEKGNEISFQTFQNFINENNYINFREEIFPKIIEIVKHSVLSVRNKININNLNYCFEIFGYDFMLDEDKNVYLIEINTNPGLEISSDIIAELVPRMIDNSLLLTVDELFPTEYSKECLNEKGQFKSKYHVNGYKDEENMWEFVVDLKKNIDKNIMNSNNFFKKGKFKNKRKKNS